MRSDRSEGSSSSAARLDYSDVPVTGRPTSALDDPGDHDQGDRGPARSQQQPTARTYPLDDETPGDRAERSGEEEG
jgi:hypothetical protein